MKKGALIIVVLATVFSCKSELKKEVKKTKVIDKVIKEVQFLPIDKWEFRGTEMVETQQLYKGENIYEISRIESDYPYAFVAINNVKLNYTGGRYRVSVLVKSGEEGAQLGLRIQEVYPTRTDVVFDLKKEVVKEIFKKGNLTDYEKSSIQPFDDGWYRCSLTVEIYSSYFKLLFGPTDVLKQIKIWETLTNVNSDLLIIPSSLKIEELED